MLRDRKRVIGTLDERIKLHQAAGDVLDRMGTSGLFSEEDIVSLRLQFSDSYENQNQDSSAFAHIPEIIEKQPMQGNEPGESLSSEV